MQITQSRRDVMFMHGSNCCVMHEDCEPEPMEEPAEDTRSHTYHT